MSMLPGATVALTGIDGTPVSQTNPLPVALTGASATISGPVSISTDAQANAAAPAATEGSQVALSVDLARNLRIVEGSADHR